MDRIARCSKNLLSGIGSIENRSYCNDENPCWKGLLLFGDKKSGWVHNVDVGLGHKICCHNELKLNVKNQMHTKS